MGLTDKFQIYLYLGIYIHDIHLDHTLICRINCDRSHTDVID
jgi:hypothetical protein